MNSLLLLLLAAVVLVFGYRFYAKLLAAGVYRLENNYSIAGPIRADGGEQMEGHRHLVFGHYFASAGTIATLLGTTLAVAWGWVPAFLGLIVGTALAGGVYGMGTLWLGLQSPLALPPASAPETHQDSVNSQDIPMAAAQVLGSQARRIFLLLIFLILLGANAVFAVLAAQLLTAYPAAVLPFWLQIPVALGLGVFLHRRPAFEIIPASAIALLLLIMLTWLAGKIPFAFTGALTGQVWNTQIFSLDSGAVWLLLLFLYLFYTARLPLWKLARARGWLTSLQTVLLLLITLGGILLLHPPVIAPEFHRGHSLAAALPWLFVVLGAGTLAGVYVLAAGGLAVKQLPAGDAAAGRYFGYGGALLDAAFALSALIAAVTAFDTPAAWRQHYGATLMPIQMLDVYIRGVTQFAGGFGIEPAFVHSFTAVILATLATTGVEAGLRLQRVLLYNLQPTAAAQPRTQAWCWLAGLFLALALYAGINSAEDWSQSWSWLGMASLVGGGLLLLLIAAQLRLRQRPVILVLAPAAVLLLLGNWALLAQVLQAWPQRDYAAFIGGFLLGGGQAGVLWTLGQRFWLARRNPAQLDTGV